MAYRTTSWKNTDIGKIPSDWDVKNLGKINDVAMCKRVMKAQTSNNGQIPFYKISTFGGAADAFISKDLYESYKNKYSYPHKGDVLFSAAGTIGKLVIFDGKPAYFQDSNIVWIPNDEKMILNSYLYHRYGVVKWATSEGGIVSRLYNKNITDTKIPVPSIPEQQKIAEVLTDVDDLIAELERVRDKKIAIKTGVMQELLKPKECWISKKLDEVCDNIFAGGTPSTANEEFWKNGDIVWLPSGMVQDAVIERRNANDRITAKGLANSSAKLIKAGTTILAMTGATCGKVAYLPFEAAANQSVMAFETTKISSKFLFYLLLNNKDYVLQFQAGGAQAGINKTSCKNFEFSFPSTKLEQEKIAQTLSDMDDEISAISKKINKYKQIKSGVAGELLSGRIRLVKPQE